MWFLNRQHAGRLLSVALGHYRGRDDLLVLALPRGGVPVGREVALALDAPLDILVVRKLGVPWHPEVAMGAVAADGVIVLNRELLRQIALPEKELGRVAQRAWQEVDRREALYRPSLPRPSVAGKTVILVDDGVATGSTMRAAINVLRARRVGRIVVAVPVAELSTALDLECEVDELICLHKPHAFLGVGASYQDFSEVVDEEVRSLLAGLDRGTRATVSQDRPTKRGESRRRVERKAGGAL